MGAQPDWKALENRVARLEKIIKKTALIKELDELEEIAVARFEEGETKRAAGDVQLKSLLDGLENRLTERTNLISEQVERVREGITLLNKDHSLLDKKLDLILEMLDKK